MQRWWINIEIPKTAKQIPDSKDWVDIDGSIYSIDTRSHHKQFVIKKSQHLVHGYCYCGIYYNSIQRCISKRVHRIVAEAFIPNPLQLEIVGHKNNNKSDNRVENLYWTTGSENTQKAVDDGLLVNDKGFEDSQSMPVKMYDVYTDEVIAEYGSVSIASKAIGISKNTILRQAMFKKPVRKPFYFRFYDDNDLQKQSLIGMFDYNTDTLIKKYFNIGDASRDSGYNSKTISQHCKSGKPRYKTFECYFQRINKW